MSRPHPPHQGPKANQHRLNAVLEAGRQHQHFLVQEFNRRLADAQEAMNMASNTQKKGGFYITEDGKDALDALCAAVNPLRKIVAQLRGAERDKAMNGYTLMIWHIKALVNRMYPEQYRGDSDVVALCKKLQDFVDHSDAVVDMPRMIPLSRQRAKFELTTRAEPTPATRVQLLEHGKQSDGEEDLM